MPRRSKELLLTSPVKVLSVGAAVQTPGNVVVSCYEGKVDVAFVANGLSLRLEIVCFKHNSVGFQHVIQPASPLSTTETANSATQLLVSHELTAQTK